MANDNILRAYPYSVAAGEFVTIHSRHRFVTILENSGSNDPQISIGDDSYSTLPKGISVELPNFEKANQIKIRNPGGSGTITGTIVLSAGRVYDNRLNLSGGISQAGGDTLTTTADVTVTNGAAAAQILAATTNRQEAIISIPDTAGSGEIRIGDSNTASGRGMRVYAGQSIAISTAAAVYCYNNSGGDIAVGLLETVI